MNVTILLQIMWKSRLFCISCRDFCFFVKKIVESLFSIIIKEIALFILPINSFSNSCRALLYKLSCHYSDHKFCTYRFIHILIYKLFCKGYNLNISLLYNIQIRKHSTVLRMVVKATDWRTKTEHKVSTAHYLSPGIVKFSSHFQLSFPICWWASI